MKTTILTDNPNSWIIPFIEQLKKIKLYNHSVSLIFLKKRYIYQQKLLFK